MLQQLKQLWRQTKCYFDSHDYGPWQDAQFIYQLEGRSKPLKTVAQIRDCKWCAATDERAKNNVWY